MLGSCRLSQSCFRKPEPIQLLRNEILPEAVPEIVGLNVTLKRTLCPAAIIQGNVMPLSVKAELLELAEEIANTATAGNDAALLTLTIPNKDRAEAHGHRRDRDRGGRSRRSC